jgi:hypothetical protein
MQTTPAEVEPKHAAPGAREYGRNHEKSACFCNRFTANRHFIGPVYATAKTTIYGGRWNF